MKIQAALTNKEGILAENLQKLVTAAAAADALSDNSKLRRMKWTELKLFTDILDKHGVEIPTKIARCVTRKFAETALNNEQLDDWIKIACPFQQDQTLGTAWSLSAPRMSLLVDCSTLEEIADVSANVLGSFLNDSGMRMIANVTTKAPNANTTLKAFVQGILSAYDDWVIAKLGCDDSEAEAPLPGLDMLVKICRGFSALLDPRPGRFQALPDDVEFLMPSRPTKLLDTLAKVLEPASSALFSHMRDSDQWKELMTEYLKVGANEKILCTEINEFADMLDNAAGMPWAERMDGYTHLVQAFPRLRPPQLRPGAVLHLEQELLSRVQAEVKSLKEESTPSAEFAGHTMAQKLACLAQLHKILAGSKTNEATEELQSLNELMSSWRAQDNQAALEEVSQMDMRSDKEVEALITKLKAAKNVDITEGMVVQLGDCRNSLHQYTAQKLLTTPVEDTVPTLLARGGEALNLLHDMKAVCEALGGQKDRNTMLAVDEVASRILSMRIPLAAGVRMTSPGTIVDNLDKAIKAHSAWSVSCKRWSKSDNGVQGPSVVALSDMLGHGATIEIQLSEYISRNAHHSIGCSMRYMKVKTEEANRIGGGHPEKAGTLWSDGLDDEATLDKVLDHAEATVLAAAGEFIDSCRKVLHEASKYDATLLAGYTHRHRCIPRHRGVLKSGYTPTSGYAPTSGYSLGP
jgi:hypothetical protein